MKKKTISQKVFSQVFPGVVAGKPSFNDIFPGARKFQVFQGLSRFFRRTGDPVFM